MPRRWNFSGLNSLVSRFLLKFEPAGQHDGGCREDQEHGVEDPLTNHANSSVFSLPATRDVFVTSAETSRDKALEQTSGQPTIPELLWLFRVGRITESGQIGGDPVGAPHVCRSPRSRKSLFGARIWMSLGDCAGRHVREQAEGSRDEVETEPRFDHAVHRRDREPPSSATPSASATMGGVRRA